MPAWSSKGPILAFWLYLHMLQEARELSEASFTFSPWVRSKATAFCETAPRPHPHGRLSSSLPSILRPLSCPQPPSPHWRGRGLSRELPRSLRGSGPKSGRVQPECSRAGSPAPGLPASSIFSVWGLANAVCRRLRCFSAGGVPVGLTVRDF